MKENKAKVQSEIACIKAALDPDMYPELTHEEREQALRNAVVRIYLLGTRDNRTYNTIVNDLGGNPVYCL